ncbi:MAG: phosphatase PAP2 family protein [Xanthobacteraceae bacterium]
MAMPDETARLRHADYLIWAVIAAVALIVGAAGTVGPFHIDLPSYLRVAAACILMVAIAGFYSRFRPDPKLASALTGTAQLIGFTAVAAPLSYIAATAGFPLQDAMLARWDESLGFDWIGLTKFVAEHPLLDRVLHYAYSSFVFQTIAVMLVLGFSNQLIRLRVFIAAFIATSLATVMMSAVVPATGPWLFYGVDSTMTQGLIPVSSTSWPVFLGLRDSTHMVFDGLNSEGIITFPSLHAGFAVLFTFAVWRTHPIRWLAVALNIAMLIATPINGSHYLVDIIAGLIIPVVGWIASARLIEKKGVHHTEANLAKTTAPSIIPDAVTARDYAGEALPQPDTRQPLKAT